MDIGFIGLGNMGAPMAANLVAAGHNLRGFDTVAAPGGGVTAVGSAAEAVSGAEIVITMLPNGAILRAVAAEVIPAMAPGAVFVDCSTVEVAAARDVARQAGAAGLGWLAAPVSGGVGGASAGTLTFMGGGADAAFATVRPLFDTMGQKAVLCGPAGSGQAAKICNNMILGVTMIATVVGVSTAWIVTAHDFPGRRIVSWALIVPLAVPSYIAAYAMPDLLQFSGPVQTWMRGAARLTRNE